MSGEGIGKMKLLVTTVTEVETDAVAPHLAHEIMESCRAGIGLGHSIGLIRFTPTRVVSVDVRPPLEYVAPDDRQAALPIAPAEIFKAAAVPDVYLVSGDGVDPERRVVRLSWPKPDAYKS